MSEAVPSRWALLLRRPVVLTAVVLAIVAGVLVGVQVRAAQAEEQRVAAALAAEQEAERERVERERAARARAELAAAERGHAAAVTALEEALAAAAAERVQAQEVLTASADQVEDDAVRSALARAIEAADVEVTAATAALEQAAAGADPGGEDPAGELVALTATLDPTALTDTTTELAGARTAVAEAQTAWLAAEAEREAQAQAAAERRAAEAARAQESAADQESSHPSGLGGPPSTGAGPDCGGPGSYEPPRNDGSPVFYTSTPTASGDGSNGRVPRSAMAPLGWCTDSQGNRQWLRADAADALTRLNAEFRAEFGENLAVDLSYRSYADQVEMREWYGSAAARPGTSNHGFGTAVDVWEWQAYSFGSARYEWLVENGPRFGWVAPSWARQGGSNPEYWHFEYTG